MGMLDRQRAARHLSCVRSIPLREMLRGNKGAAYSSACHASAPVTAT